MPIVIILIGIVLVFAAINNKLSNLSQLLQDDWNPSSGTSFGVWALAIVIIGAIGYVKQLKPFSNAFLVLVFIGIMLSNKGFFNQFMAAFENKNLGGLGKGPSGGSSGSSSGIPSLLGGNSLSQVVQSFSGSLEGLPSVQGLGGNGGSSLDLPLNTNLNVLNLGGD